MKNIKYILLITVLFAIILPSCTKDDGLDNSVNFDALYVVNSAGNSLSVIDLSAGRVEKTINLATLFPSMSGSMMNGSSIGNNMWPYHISISPDKSKLVITEPGMDFDGGYEMMQTTTSSVNGGDIHYQHHNGNFGTLITDVMQMRGNIIVLDAVTGDLINEITLEGMPYDAIFTPDGKEIWTTLMMPVGKILVFDGDSYNLLNTITVGYMPAGITFSEDGKKAFVANGMSGSITVIDAVTKITVGNIITDQGTVGVFPGMHGMMYADNEKDHFISIISTMNNMMSDTIQIGFTPGMISKNEVFNQLWISDPEGSKIHFWTPVGKGYLYGGSVAVGAGAGAMIFSQSGKTCYVTNQNDNSVSVVDVEMLKETLKIPVGEKPNGLIIRYK